MAVTLALAVATGAAPVQAANAARYQSAEDKVKRAEELYQKGTAKFETADYKAAIELWSEAYTEVPADPAYAEIKALLLYNIATAREKAFEVYGEVAQLRQAEILLNNFEQSIPAIYQDPVEQEAELAKVRERKEKLAAAIASATAEPEPEPEPEPAPEPEPEPAPEPAPIEDTPEPDPSAKVFIGVGAGLMVVGAAGLGVMAGGLAMGGAANDISGLDETDTAARADQFARGRTGNAMAIAGGVLGGVFLATGVALLVVGQKRARQTALAPALGPGFAGLQLTGRF